VSGLRKLKMTALGLVITTRTALTTIAISGLGSAGWRIFFHPNKSLRFFRPWAEQAPAVGRGVSECCCCTACARLQTRPVGDSVYQRHPHGTPLTTRCPRFCCGDYSGERQRGRRSARHCQPTSLAHDRGCRSADRAPRLSPRRVTDACMARIEAPRPARLTPFSC